MLVDFSENLTSDTLGIWSVGTTVSESKLAKMIRREKLPGKTIHLCMQYHSVFKALEIPF